jgi:hypothetical protein
VPEIITDLDRSTAWVEPDTKLPLTFRTVGQPQSFSLVPLNSVFHERYTVYWKLNPASDSQRRS